MRWRVDQRAVECLLLLVITASILTALEPIELNTVSIEPRGWQRLVAIAMVGPRRLSLHCPDGHPFRH